MVNNTLNRILFIPVTKKSCCNFFLLFTMIFSVVKINAQEEPVDIQNLKRYDSDWLHFGFTLGINSSTFRIKHVDDFYSLGSVKVVQAVPQGGFNLGIISEVSITKNLKIRFIPDLSFAQRNIKYTFIDSVTTNYVKKVESTFLDFPLELKFKSKRVSNFGAYWLTGFKYTVDLASQKDVDNANSSLDEQKIRVNKNDYAYAVGGGIDIYLQYFKFSIDLKLSMGLKDLFVKDNTVFAAPIDQLKSRTVLISFNFEG